MRAVVFHEFGHSDVLRSRSSPTRRPGQGEVVIDVTATALNHLDVDVREGMSRFPVEPPHVLGVEPVGRISEIGDGVEGWQVGDRVAAYLIATCGSCSYLPHRARVAVRGAGVVRRHGLRRRLRGEGDLQAVPADPHPRRRRRRRRGGRHIAFGTAWHMLIGRAHLQPGETVLINSVGSGIGSAAVQVAKHAGAIVIGNSSRDDKLERATALGMDVGINYTTQDVVEEVMKVTDGRGVDVVYEHVGGELFQKGIDSLTKDGRLVICGGHSGEVVPFDIILLPARSRR